MTLVRPRTPSYIRGMPEPIPPRRLPSRQPLPAGAAERRYDDRDVSRLLKRAAELQRSSGGTRASTGLTLGELEEIAGEAGIDPGSLRRAAAELEEQRDAGGRAGRLFAGAPMRLLYERTLPFEASAVALDSLLPAIELGAAVPGQLTRSGNTLSWRSDDKVTPRRVNVVVSVRNGQTVVRLEEWFGTLTGVLYGAVVVPCTGASLGVGAALSHALLGAAMIFAVPATVAVAGVALVRSGLRAKIRSRRKALERLLEELTETLAGSASDRQLTQ